MIVLSTRSILAATMAVLLSGCAAAEPDRPKPTASASASITRGAATELVVGPWAVRLPGAVSTGVLSARAVELGQQLVELDPALRAAGYVPGSGLALDIGLDSGPPPAGSTVTLKLPGPFADGPSPVLASLSADGTVAVHASQPSSDGTSVTALAKHFSVWTDLVSTLQYNVNDFFGQRGDPPSCSGSLPSWAADVDYLDDPNGPQLYCTGADPKDSSLAVIKVSNNRGYAQWVIPNVSPRWMWSSEWNVFGIADVFEQLGSIGPGVPPGAILMPAKSEVHLAFDEKSSRSIKAGLPIVTVLASPTSYFAQLIADRVEELIGQKGAAFATVLGVVAADKCAVDIVLTDDPLDAAGALLDCLVDNKELIYRLSAEMAVDISDDTQTARLIAKSQAQVLILLAAIDVGKVIISLQEFNQQAEITRSAPGLVIHNSVPKAPALILDPNGRLRLQGEDLSKKPWKQAVAALTAYLGEPTERTEIGQACETHISPGFAIGWPTLRVLVQTESDEYLSENRVGYIAGWSQRAEVSDTGSGSRVVKPAQRFPLIVGGLRVAESPRSAVEKAYPNGRAGPGDGDVVWDTEGIRFNFLDDGPRQIMWMAESGYACGS